MSVSTATIRPNNDAIDAKVVIGLYTWIVGGFTLALMISVAVLGAPNEAAAAVIMLLAVGLIGLPHGAFDYEVARRTLAPRVGRAWWVFFGSAYVALALVGFGIWVTVPLVGLVVLLVGGSLHWGVDDLGEYGGSGVSRLWIGASRGAIPVAAPMVFHPMAVAEVFTSLLGNMPVSTELVRVCSICWIAAALPGLVVSVWPRRAMSLESCVRHALEPVVLVLWFAVVPPILAFTVYFCLWHSVRHSLRSALDVPASPRIWYALSQYARAVAVPTVLTWVLAAVAAVVLIQSSGFAEISWKITFIGLFALTIPHVLLDLLELRVVAGEV